MRQVPGVSDRSDILRFWWMLELFSPQKLPTVTPHTTRPEDHQVIAWRSEIPLPWDQLPPPRPKGQTERVWLHTVYLGTYELKATFDILGRVFGEDPEANEKQPQGESACAALLIDANGRLLTGSPVLSSALWATGRAHHLGTSDPTWMEGFELAQERFGEVIDTFEGTRRDAHLAEEAVPHTSESLLQLLRIAHSCAGINDLAGLAQEGIIIDSRAFPKPKEGSTPPEVDFLNSFFLDDLARVRREVARGNFAPGLRDYLTDDTALDVHQRIDVIAHAEAVEDGTRVKRIPKGRWPAKPEHGLALSQQFAVNRALHDLAVQGGVMGVNGPPGTGKTTMLRDILAGNIVERARRLAELTRPSDAFTGEFRWSDGDGNRRTVPRLIPELTGFEMVVASSNNAAVENVTAEIPAESAIAAPWRGNVGYFKEIASEILYAKPTGAWALIAAKLGRRSNRTDFRSNFWFGDTDTKDKPTSKNTRPSVPRMQERLKMWRDGADPHAPWREARKAFRAAEERVDSLLEQRSQAEHRLASLRGLLHQQRDLQNRLQPQRQRAEQAHSMAAGHIFDERRTKADSTRALERRNRHLETRPGFLEIFFTLGKAIRRWRRQLEALDAHLEHTEQALQQAHAEGERLRQAAVTAQAEVTVTETELASIAAAHHQLLSLCHQDAQRFGKAYPGPAWQGRQRELHAPWLDAELDRARSDLFIAALQLHEDFLANAASTMLHGLRAACEIVAGRIPANLEPEKVLAAWQLFFLVVPTVSTTFASASRMFGDLGPEAIGWLLIDEAGQAMPQHAVGLIWRARRTIAVGDPLQLKPVVTIPEKAMRNIAVTYTVGSTWLPPRASVQTLADRVTRHGTLLDQGEDSVWVSAPLRVHRRCDDPMFSFCNRIAYNDLMVSGVHRVLDDPTKPDLFDNVSAPRITPSQWIHVPSETRGTHLQQNQIEELRRGLDHLRSHQVPLKEIFAISPFRAVADILEDLRFDHPGLKAGTIHTAQGREADVVFLILGGDPDKPGGPAMWSDTPNLINVAVSRARRRIYVIGDLGMWGSQNYFRDLRTLLRPSS